MRGTAEKRLPRCSLHDFAGIHYSHPMRRLSGNPEIVRNEQDRHPVALLEAAHEIEHLGLNGDIQGGRGLIGDKQLWLSRQRHGYHHPLFHST